jgi:CRISPR/Cas system-associated exonuclease Cas4 (RecB family)
MIWTTEDLKNATPEEVEKVRSRISIKEHYYVGLRRTGRSVGLTLDEYEKWQEQEPTDPCPTCKGTGLWKKPVRSVGCIHASSAHTCRRRLYYDVVADHAPKQEISPELQHTFRIGHAMHDVAQAALHESLAGSFRDEVRVDMPEAFITNSRTDGVIELPHTRVLLEIKSIGSEFDRLTEPKKDHLTQAVGIYATALDIPFISFLYISKKWPLPVKEFVVAYDGRIYRKWWRSKGSHVENALEAGEPPVADANKQMCSQCPYNYFCTQRIR